MDKYTYSDSQVQLCQISSSPFVAPITTFLILINSDALWKIYVIDKLVHDHLLSRDLF